MSFNEKIRAKDDLITITKHILAGQISPLLGVRKLRYPLSVLELDNHSDFVLFKAIDSETDHLPIGPEREHWNPDSLKQKDIEIQERENLERDEVFKTCDRLLKYLDQIKF